MKTIRFAVLLLPILPISSIALAQVSDYQYANSQFGFSITLPTTPKISYVGKSFRLMSYTAHHALWVGIFIYPTSETTYAELNAMAQSGNGGATLSNCRNADTDGSYPEPEEICDISDNVNNTAISGETFYTIHKGYFYMEITAARKTMPNWKAQVEHYFDTFNWH